MFDAREDYWLLAIDCRYKPCILLFRPLHKTVYGKWDIANFITCGLALISRIPILSVVFIYYSRCSLSLFTFHFYFFPLLLFRKISAFSNSEHAPRWHCHYWGWQAVCTPSAPLWPVLIQFPWWCWVWHCWCWWMG